MILITGGSGFLGAHLTYRLLKYNYKVRILKRKSGDLKLFKLIFNYYCRGYEKLLNKIEWVDGDILDVTSLENALIGIDEVYHVAALIAFRKKDRKKLYEVNVKGTENVVNASINANVRKFCYVSSIASLGRAASGKMIDEKSVWEDSNNNTYYGKSKYLAEKEVWRGIAEGLSAVIVNPSIILGFGDLNSGGLKMISTINNGLKFYPQGVNGFVDVKDVAEIMIKIMKSDVSGERFIINGENLSYFELFQMIADIMNTKTPSIKANRLISHITWIYYLIKSVFLNDKPTVTRETARTSMAEFFYSNKKSIHFFDVKYIPVKKTIADISEAWKTKF